MNNLLGLIAFLIFRVTRLILFTNVYETVKSKQYYCKAIAIINELLCATRFLFSRQL